MVRSTGWAFCLLAFTSWGAYAQANGGGEGAASSGPGARGGNITSTGQTTPLPGASKGEGTTPLDRGVQKKDNEIPSSICKGC